MQNDLLIAVLAGLSGMLGWGLADFFAKKTIDVAGDMATLAWAHIYGAVFLASLVFARYLSDGNTIILPTNPMEIGKIVFFGVLQAAVYTFVYRGFGKGKLALLNPVFSSFSGFVVLLSVIIFGEVVSASQLALLGVVFLGILAINVDRTSFAIRRLKLARIPGMKDILAAVVLATFWTVLWGHFVTNKDWLLYAALMYLFMTIAILFICAFQRVKMSVLNTKTWRYFLFIGLSEVIAYIGISIGYSETTHVSIIAVLSAAFSVPTLILAHMFLKERITPHQVFGVLLVIAGVSLISLV